MQCFLEKEHIKVAISVRKRNKNKLWGYIKTKKPTIYGKLFVFNNSKSKA